MTFIFDPLDSQVEPANFGKILPFFIKIYLIVMLLIPFTCSSQNTYLLTSVILLLLDSESAHIPNYLSS